MSRDIGKIEFKSVSYKVELDDAYSYSPMNPLDENIRLYVQTS
jgi:hypothetical protein